MIVSGAVGRVGVVATCAMLLWAGTALAQPTGQQKCDMARVKAWGKYVSCVQNVVAKIVGGGAFQSQGFAKCRHKFFSRWAKLQGAAYTGSTCTGSRFTDNLDDTVTDNLSGLTWEKKNDFGGPNDKDAVYSWSTNSPWVGDGTLFTTYLSPLNSSGHFGVTSDWRLPTLVELQTISMDFECTAASCSCGSIPCIEPALDASNTQSDLYWSATTVADSVGAFAWSVNFLNAVPTPYEGKPAARYVRLVRGGL